MQLPVFNHVLQPHVLVFILLHIEQFRHLLTVAERLAYAVGIVESLEFLHIIECLGIILQSLVDNRHVRIVSLGIWHDVHIPLDFHQRVACCEGFLPSPRLHTFLHAQCIEQAA